MHALCEKCTNSHIFFLIEGETAIHSICFVCGEIDSAIPVGATAEQPKG